MTNNLMKRIIGRFFIGVALTFIVSALFLLVSNVSKMNANMFGNMEELVGYVEDANSYFASLVSSRGDILFSALSLVFLVISFVSLLAGKTESIYWVDAVHYHLIEPRYFSIIDMATYLFSSLFCCTITYLLSGCSLDFLSVGSFVVIIVFLTIMSFKLLVAFFAKDNTKRKLKREYERALDYRRIVYNVLQDEIKDEVIPLYKYSEQYGYQDEIIKAYAILKADEKQLDKLIGKDKKRFQTYEKKYGQDVNAFAKMRDGLFANLLDCIERNSISDIVEQVAFLAQYHEYNLVFFAFDEILKSCPAAVPAALNQISPILAQCSKEKEDEIYREFEVLLDNIAKTKNYFRICNVVFMDSLETIIRTCKIEMLQRLVKSDVLQRILFKETLSRKQAESISYQTMHAVLKRMEMQVEEYCSANDENYRKRSMNAISQFRQGILNLILNAILSERYDVANHIMHNYMQFLESISLYQIHKKIFPVKRKAGAFPLGMIEQKKMNENVNLEQRRIECLNQLCWRMPSELLKDIDCSIDYVDVMGEETAVKCLWNIFANCTGIYDLSMRFIRDVEEKLFVVESIKEYFETLVVINKRGNYPMDDDSTGKNALLLFELAEYVVSEDFQQLWKDAHDRDSELTKLVTGRFEDENLFSADVPTKLRAYFFEKFDVDFKDLVSRMNECK